MKWLGYRQIALKSIVVDAPDIRLRMKQPHVIELAANIQKHGEEPANAPSIRGGLTQSCAAGTATRQCCC
jgi:hypothetical protein